MNFYIPDAVLELLCVLLIGGGLCYTTGIVDIVTFAMIGALAGGLLLIKFYLPPVAIVALAACVGLAWVVKEKGGNALLVGVAGALIMGAALLGNVYLPPAALVRTSLTVMFLMGVRFLMRG